MNLYGRELTRCLLSITLLAFSYTTVRAADIDLTASKITVHVDKSGMFAAFAHNHVISAPLASGRLDREKRTIELKFRSHDMKVVDPDVSESDRAEIERTMKENVLETGRFPEIVFASTEVSGTRLGDSLYALRIQGGLSLHGATHMQSVIAQMVPGDDSLRAYGEFSIRQTDFNIKLVSVAGGALKVKDELKFSFDIVARKQA